TLEQHGVRGYRDRGGAHRQRRDGGAEEDAERIEDARRDGNGDQVVDRRPEEVLPHLHDGGLREANRGQHILWIAAHQHDLRRLGRMRSATAMSPARWLSTATVITVLPCAWSALMRSVTSSVSATPCSPSSAGVPINTVSPSTVAWTPPPAMALKSRVGGRS